MNIIENPKEHVICRFDGVNVATVYRGMLSCLVNASEDLKWRKETPFNEFGIEEELEVLTLQEIKNQLKCPMITIIIEGPLSGELLQYGNYGDSWYSIGQLVGYA